MMHYSKKLLLILTLCLLSGFVSPAVTYAWFFDTEVSDVTEVTAGILDFRLTKTVFDAFIGKEADGEKEVTTVAIPEDESMDMQYMVTASTSPAVCDDFTVVAKQNEDVVYSGAVAGFAVAPTTEFGTWNFEFDIPSDASVSHGEVCQSEFVFHAWREDVANPAESGFYAIKNFSVTLHAKTVVLNEVLAHPDTAVAAPANVEFIELKNIGDTPVDISGWEIGEISGSSEVRHMIVGTGAGPSDVNTLDGDTVIAPGDYAVLLFGGSASYLNNAGDTIALYDTPETNTKLDVYAYATSLEGKSDARYLDGLGSWVDPIPTPGEPNTLAETAKLEIKIIGGEITTDKDGDAVTDEEVNLIAEDEVAPEEEIVEDEVQDAPIDPETNNEEGDLGETGEGETEAGEEEGEESVELADEREELLEEGTEEKPVLPNEAAINDAEELLSDETTEEEEAAEAAEIEEVPTEKEEVNEEPDTTVELPAEPQPTI